MRRILRALFGRRYAEGGHLPPPSDRDDTPLFLSGERVWRVVDGKLVEADDRVNREFNKLRERP